MGKNSPSGIAEQAVRDFYSRLDEALAGENLTCSGCGGCCHFESAEHILYASALERQYLSAAPLPRCPDGDPRQLAAGMRCPWQSDNQCQARDRRALGCRLHFCQWNDSERESAFSERWHNELKKLHETLHTAWDYRPLLPLTD